MSEVSINSKLLDFLSQNNIVMHFFNYYEGYSGTFYPKKHYNSGKLIVKQVEAYKDKRLMVAKSIVSAIGENIYELLYHYYRHDRTEVKGTLEWIKNDMKINLEKANNIKEIMQVEGETWYRFYGEFKIYYN